MIEVNYKPEVNLTILKVKIFFSNFLRGFGTLIKYIKKYPNLLEDEKIYDNFILDTETYKWIPPIPYPTDGEHYVWDDKNNEWVDAQLVGNDYD